jgi:hypothetical protein
MSEWKLIPVEPTGKQIDDAMSACSKLSLHDVLRVYKSIITSAPAAPTAEPAPTTYTVMKQPVMQGQILYTVQVPGWPWIACGNADDALNVARRLGRPASTSEPVPGVVLMHDGPSLVGAGGEDDFCKRRGALRLYIASPDHTAVMQQALEALRETMSEIEVGTARWRQVGKAADALRAALVVKL